MEQGYCEAKIKEGKKNLYAEVGIQNRNGRLLFGDNLPRNIDSLILCGQRCDLSRKIHTLNGREIKYCGAVRR